MDLKLFKLDIDELINEFVECESTTFAEFKRIWLSKKFSFIFEASPSTNPGFFMQSLYAHSIGHMVSTGSLSYRVGGLYCLYCLYETQPFKPPFKIYLSLGEMRQLKNLVIDAKRTGVKVVSVLVKSMLEKNMFLFGFVGTNEGSVTERVNELTDLQNARVQAAYKKLFADSRLEHFIHMDLGMELDVDLLKKKSSDYAVAKEVAIKEASQAINVENVKHIAEKRRLIGEIVGKSAADWNEQKEMFYEKTGFGHPPTIAAEENDNRKRKEPCDNVEEHDDFGTELEQALLFQRLESDNEEVEPTDEWENDT
ncbi:hypothetical protein BUALT_Bualt16G0072100 [Buddleja alternifolia]|uniref:snRNA-activating protein complex subunit 1 n=1 Tax=Buddleja alternifolia TaxID=168488 RepID=A0AAV6WGC1_9LAMI|nr:hypothetical protein BUALT_Bualt16G0072100 [Buddleja alternifolia]